MNSKLVAAAVAFTLGTYAHSVHALEAPSKPDTRAEQHAKNMSEAIADAWITTKVKTDLLAAEDVAGTRIDVDTKNGIVTLHGTVKSQVEADKAVSVAKGIKGVTSVTSNLRVMPLANK